MTSHRLNHTFVSGYLMFTLYFTQKNPNHHFSTHYMYPFGSKEDLAQEKNVNFFA